MTMINNAISNRENTSRIYRRKATFIIGKDDPLVQPLFQMIDAMDKPHAMKIGLILVQSTIDDVFIHTPYLEPIQFGWTMGQKWLTHDITMTIMRPIILHIHGLTKQCADPFLSRHIHAVGQALSTLHCQDHLKGWYLYSLAAWFYQTRRKAPCFSNGDIRRFLNFIDKII